MEKVFKIEDIKAGYLLRFRGESGREVNMTAVPIREYEPSPLVAALLGFKANRDGELGLCGDGEYWPLNMLSEDLTYDGLYKYRVIEVYGYTAPQFLLDNSTERRELLWRREERKPKLEVTAVPVKMTLKEIGEALGYPVEVAE